MMQKNICLIPGVGNKVADCTMLFSLDKLESFPLDRWMIRILQKYYSDKFQFETKTITEKQYDIIHKKNCKLFWSIFWICTTIPLQNGKGEFPKRLAVNP